MRKLFGIGLHKTGTTTLAECFRILGYSVCPEIVAFATLHSTAARNYGPLFEVADRHDAFEDAPWNYPNAFQALHRRWDSAKFILTVRDSVRWFESFERWCRLVSNPYDFSILHSYGVPMLAQNREAAIRAYERHAANVRNYFDDKVLVVDWEAGDGWAELCSFLGKPVPDHPFPHKLRYDPETNTYLDRCVNLP